MPKTIFSEIVSEYQSSVTPGVPSQRISVLSHKEVSTPKINDFVT